MTRAVDLRFVESDRDVSYVTKKEKLHIVRGGVCSCLTAMALPVVPQNCIASHETQRRGMPRPAWETRAESLARAESVACAERATCLQDHAAAKAMQPMSAHVLGIPG